MNEDQAKLRWCPFALTAVSDMKAPARNRHPDGTYLGCTCIASECMAWRWSMSPKSVAEVNARGNAGAVASGYCGLGGKP